MDVYLILINIKMIHYEKILTKKFVKKTEFQFPH